MNYEYEPIHARLNEQFTFKSERISKEGKVVENIFATLNEKLPWYKPWKFFSHFIKMRRAILLLSTITSSCLSEVISLQKNQLNLLDVQMVP